MHELIAAAAATTPDAIAVIAGNARLSYRDLNARANQLGRCLRANGVRPDNRVALCLRSTADLLVGMLGILKSGGAYVPLDPSYPIERLTFMIRDANAKILVTTADLAKMELGADATVVRLDADWSDIEKERQEDFDPVVHPENLAYVIYTSGSTGQPKGVMVTHSGLANYLLWAVKEYAPEAGRSALVHSSISFDLTITGLFTPLLLGGRVELLPEEAGVDGLFAALYGNKKYGLVKITPAQLELLRYQTSPQEIADKVGLFVIGGESLTANSLRFWREFSPRTRLINEYGPTETVVGCCTYEVAADDPHFGSVPIGRPIDNTQLYVLDEKGRPLPSGAAGELYIGGAGVAHGYLNRPELTQERFLFDPFAERPDARMYRTGDLVRRRESGIFEYLGRLDDQIKLYGHRIELGEVEATISEHPSIRQSAVAVQTKHSGHKQLVGYAVRQENQTITQADLRSFLSQKLPNYMIPNSIIFVDSLQLTSNGKIDRHNLPFAEESFFGTGVRHKSKENFEEKIAEIFKNIFNVDSVNDASNFFDLGANSLHMIDLFLQIEKAFDKNISMAELFENPHVAGLAAVLRDQRANPPEIIALQPAGFGQPFFCFGAGPRFQPLATRLGDVAPFLSLLPNTRSAEFARLGPSCKIEDIAAYSARLICEYQKEGPYYLGGWSASGVVAYEIAQQLMAAGHEVGLLALFDVKNPTFQPFGAAWVEAQRQKMRFFAKELRELRLRDARRYVNEKLQESKRKLRVLRLKRNNNIEKKLDDLVLEAVADYRPQAYSGRVVFFSAASRPDGNAWDFSQAWQELVTREFEVCDVPGDHRSMFSKHNVVHIVAKLMNCLTTIHLTFVVSLSNELLELDLLGWI